MKGSKIRKKKEAFWANFPLPFRFSISIFSVLHVFQLLLRFSLRIFLLANFSWNIYKRIEAKGTEQNNMIVLIGLRTRGIPVIDGSNPIHSCKLCKQK